MYKFAMFKTDKKVVQRLKNLKNALNKYYSFLNDKKTLRKIVLLCSLITILDVIAMASAYLLLIKVISNADISVIKRTGAITSLVVLLILISWLKKSQDLLIANTNCQIEFRERNRLADKISHSKWKSISSYTQGNWVSAMMSEPTMVANGISAYLNLVTNFVGLFLTYILCLFVSFESSASIILIFALAVLLSQKIRTKAKLNEISIQDRNIAIGEQASSLLANIKTVIASDTQNKWLIHIQSTINELLKSRKLQIILNFKSRFNAESVTVIGLGIILFISSILAKSPEAVGVVLILFYRMSPKFQALQQNWMTVQTQVVWLDKWEKLIDEISQATLGKEIEPIINFWGDWIEISDFQIGSKSIGLEVSAPILRILRGEPIIVTGISGSGKSTLIDSLLELFDSSTCHILDSNGSMGTQWNKTFFGKISYIPQNAYLGVGRISEILLSDSDLSTRRIVELFTAFDLSDLIVRDKDFLESEIINAWAGLSGGEKQRLALIKAILSDSDTIILDEATNALDPVLERKVMNFLIDYCKLSKKILVAIIHRESLLDLFSQSWNIEGLVVVETHVK